VTIADSEYDAMFTVRTDAGGRPTLERSRFGAASAAR
jgi:hypothetical protein